MALNRDAGCCTIFFFADDCRLMQWSGKKYRMNIAGIVHSYFRRCRRWLPDQILYHGHMRSIVCSACLDGVSIAYRPATKQRKLSLVSHPERIASNPA